MEPPSYTEQGCLNPYRARTIDWNEIMPYMTPQKITPKMYEALLVLARHFIREFAEAKQAATRRKQEFDYSQHARNLSWSRILWKIVYTFSESHFSVWFFSHWLACRLSKVRKFGYVYCVRIIPLLSTTWIITNCRQRPRGPIFTGDGLVVIMKKQNAAPP